MTTYDTLRIERRGPVGWLVFDRPDVGNAMNAVMIRELEVAWHELDDDADVRVIVNTGADGRVPTGLDMVQLAGEPDALREQSRRTKRFELRFTAWHNDVWKPVIAAVNGVCTGGGLHFVADADVVLMAAAATLVDPHVSVGQATVYETIHALGQESPMEAVLRMALVGRHERISAARAYELGICSEVAPTVAALHVAAQDLAELITRQPAEQLAADKRLLWEALEHVTKPDPTDEQGVRL